MIWGTSKSELRVNGVKQKYRYYYFIPASVPVHRQEKEYRSWNIEYLERNFLLFCLQLDWQRIAETSCRRPEIDWEKRREDLKKRAHELKTEIGNLYALGAAGDLEGVRDEIKKREQEKKQVGAELEKILAEKEQEKQAAADIRKGMSEGEALMKKVLHGQADQDTRLRLREEIRKRVERIDIFAMGYDLAQKIEQDFGVPLNGGKVRCYRVTFRNGSFRWVVPGGKKDTEIQYILDENTTGEMDLSTEKFELRESHDQRRGRRVRPWIGLRKTASDQIAPKQDTD